MSEGINDPWFEQKDVMGRFAQDSAWTSEWIPVFETRDSYVEHLYAIALPMKRKRAVDSMHDVAWGNDFDNSHARIVYQRLGHAHYLGLRFRRMFNLSFNGWEYRSRDIGPVARQDLRQRRVGRYETISARLEAIKKFLAETKQDILWCIRSHRYSERPLEEFCSGLTNRQFKGERANYVFEAMNLSGNKNQDFPRMQSMTLVFGKRILLLT